MKFLRGRLNLPKAPKGSLAFVALGVLILALTQGCASQSSQSVAKQVEATRELGVVLMNEGRPREALREFLNAQRMDPKDVKVQDYLGLTLLTLEKPAEAVTHFQNAVKIDPAYLNAKNNLGSAYLALEQWDQAIGVFNDLLADLTYPTPWKPAAGLGWAYFNKGSMAKAREYYLMSLDQSPTHAIAWRGLGRVCLEEGAPEEAASCLEKAVALAPYFAEAYFDLGEAYVQSGHRGKAREAWEKVCPLAPGSQACARATSKVNSLQTAW